MVFTMKKIWARQALLPEGWAQNVRVDINDDGTIGDVVRTVQSRHQLQYKARLVGRAAGTVEEGPVRVCLAERVSCPLHGPVPFDFAVALFAARLVDGLAEAAQVLQFMSTQFAEF